MGLTRAAAVAVKKGLSILPASYAEKVAKKIKNELAVYGEFAQEFSTPSGPIQLAGLGWRGTHPDITKLEPETVRWIDEYIKPNDVVWDVGGHVGVYTIYAAKRGANVVAFEPFAASYLQLSKNIIANQLDKNVVALNIALSNATGTVPLQLRSFESGVSSTIPGYELEECMQHPVIGEQHVLTMPGAHLVEHFAVPAPHHIKIDVDGSESLVLQGLAPLLSGIATLIIEVIGEFQGEFEDRHIPDLTKAGLREIPIDQPSSGRNRLFVRK